MPKNTRYSDELIAEGVRNSFNITQVMKYIGMQFAGGSHHWLSQRIKRSGLDTSHFNSDYHRSNFGPNHKGGPRKRLHGDVLVRRESGRREKTPILRRSLDELGVIYQCAVCGVGDSWQGKALVLHIDHIDGDNLNNEYINLRYICPNCHSQTSTYCRTINSRS